MAKSIKNNVYWTGKVDWSLRKFHGDELSTHRGSTYNSYLIREGKNILIDTVWAPFAKEFVAELTQAIDLKRIDAVIAQHGEIDHSGALPELLRHIPDVPVYCTANGVKSLKGHYHADWNFKPVKTGDKIDIGNGKELIFVEAPMLHWPDTMFTYMTKDNILFSNDAFGQHYGTDKLFNDLVDREELYAEAVKYYANILTPFNRMVDKKIKEFVAMNLPLDMICTSHGIIWRDNPKQIVEAYLKWSADYQENQITILYDTMWEGTRAIAETIAKGIREADKDVAIKVFRLSNADKNDAITEVFKSKAVLVGSPTINKGILTGVAGISEEIKGMGFKNKKAAAFGCYGWSGESVKLLNEELKKCGFTLANEGINALWNPDAQAIEKCLEFGKAFAQTV